jgi:hypothetical protein
MGGGERGMEGERERAAFTFTAWRTLSDASAVRKGQSYSLK